MTQTAANTTSTASNSDAKAANRCTFRFPNGSRCLLSVVDTSTGLCYSHAKLQFQHSDRADLSDELFPSLPEDKLPDLTTAEHINVMLSRIVLFLAQGRISPRRAAVMTFEGSLLVRCVTAMDRAPNFIFDLPRPKASSSEENDPASPAEYSSRPHTRTMLGVCDYGRMRTFLFVAVLCLCGCKGQPKETSVGYTAEQTQAIAALREAYAAFNRGDIDAAVKSLDEHIEWSEPAEFPGGGTYHGREGAKRYLAQSRAAWAEVVSEPEQFIVHGDQVVVFVHARVRAKGNNDWQDVKLADVYTFRDGKAIRMQAFADRQQALRSVGVEAPAG